jgi:hypothetical protein
MDTLSNFDLYMSFAVAVLMPLLIVVNLMDLSSSPFNAYLWRENPNLMRVSLVMLGLLALNAMVSLAEHYGLVSTATAEYATPVLGIPFMITSIAVIWLSVRAVKQYLRTRRSQA